MATPLADGPQPAIVWTYFANFSSRRPAFKKAVETDRAHMDVETEIVELKRRLTALEKEVKAEQQFSVRLFNYVREMRDDLAMLRSHAVVMDGRISRLEELMDRVEQRLDAVERRLEKVERDLAGFRSEFNDFRKELPGIIVETMREVLREYRTH